MLRRQRQSCGMKRCCWRLYQNPLARRKPFSPRKWNWAELNRRPNEIVARKGKRKPRDSNSRRGNPLDRLAICCLQPLGQVSKVEMARFELATFRLSVECSNLLSYISKAEGVGFEPTEAFTSLVFKTRAINHSTTLPGEI